MRDRSSARSFLPIRREEDNGRDTENTPERDVDQRPGKRHKNQRSQDHCDPVNRSPNARKYPAHDMPKALPAPKVTSSAAKEKSPPRSRPPDNLFGIFSRAIARAPAPIMMARMPTILSVIRLVRGIPCVAMLGKIHSWINRGFKGMADTPVSSR